MPERQPIIIDLGGPQIRLQSTRLHLSERDIIYEVRDGSKTTGTGQLDPPADIKLFTVPAHHIEQHWQTAGRVPSAQTPASPTTETALPMRHLAALAFLVETIEPGFVEPIRAALHVPPQGALSSDQDIWTNLFSLADVRRVTPPSFCAWLNLDDVPHTALVAARQENDTVLDAHVAHLRLEIGAGEGIIWEPRKLTVVERPSAADRTLTKLLLATAEGQSQ